MTADRRTLADSAHAALRSAILDGTLEDGSIVNQVELARRYGMSRVPIREAVQRLIAEGLLVSSSHQRARVAAIGPNEVAELVDIREELEALALRRLMRGGHETALENAARINDQLAQTGERTDSVALDLEFHLTLMSSMPRAASIVLDIRKRTQKYIDRLQVPGTPRPNGATEHAEVLEAVRAGDPAEAERRLRRHIDHTRRLLAAAAPEEQETPGELAPRSPRPL